MGNDILDLEVDLGKIIDQDNAAINGVKGIKHFKSSADVENFYRFVNDHGLRKEAKLIFDHIMPLMNQAIKKKIKNNK